MFLRSALAAFALALASPALAGSIVPYDAAAFTAAQAANAPIVIHVTAPWCPTCRAQKPVVERLVDDPANADLVVFDVDFDSEKDVLRQFNVRAQSTLIAWRGSTEMTRSVGVTDPAAIAALVASTR